MGRDPCYNGFTLEPGEVAVLTFNQPGVNIFSTDVLNSFIQAMEAVGRSRTIKTLVIISDGKNFLVGADIKEMSCFSRQEALEFSTLFHRALNRVDYLRIPVIAGVNGYALGGGCELALACDMVVAAETATFGQPEINLGIIPGAGGTQRLAERVGKLKAKELILTGMRISASEALSIGLINRIVPDGKLHDEVIALATVIASKPLHCLESLKSLINEGTMEREIDVFADTFTHEDQKRLMDKFLKREK